MAPTFTIFQDPPAAPTTRASTFTSLKSASASTRPHARLASSSTSIALDVDKENVDPSTGLSRASPSKHKTKKALSIKTKDNTSKASTKASKAPRGGSATPGPAKPANTLRATPYRPVLPLPVSEVSFHLASSTVTPTPCLIAGFSASSMGDFAEPEFDLYSDFVDQPSPPRSRPDSMWSELPPVLETAGDRKARDLTELPLADLSEAFTTGTKKSIRQKKVLPSSELTLSLFGSASSCLSSPSSQTTPCMEHPYAGSVDLAVTTGFF